MASPGDVTAEPETQAAPEAPHAFYRFAKQIHCEIRKGPMISKAVDVQAYIAELPPERQAAIERLRSLCRQQLVGYEERMEYGMPVYRRNGVVEVSYASQRQCIALYVLKQDIVNEFRSALSGSKIGKGCIRFAKPDKINFDVVKQLLGRTADSTSEPC
jgi:uncharacterized protein YdhG (YjbR/CyaY superfamily)